MLRKKLTHIVDDLTRSIFKYIVQNYMYNVYTFFVIIYIISHIFFTVDSSVEKYTYINLFIRFYLIF